MKRLLLLMLLFFPATPQKSVPGKVVEPWGWHTILDLEDCDPVLIRDRNHIHSYAVSLCHIIGMKSFGLPIIVHFGQEESIAGFSLVQLIETSLISGHFANASNSAYIDIFSCKKYDDEIAAQFTAGCFGARIKKKTVILRS